MCDLHSMTKGQDAIRQLFRIMRDRAGNPPQPHGIFPDNLALIIRRSADGERERIMARWGMPTPPKFLKPTVDATQQLKRLLLREDVGRRNTQAIRAEAPIQGGLG
jgi:putative SOS response-associated peptidase YedK